MTFWCAKQDPLLSARSVNFCDSSGRLLRSLSSLVDKVSGFFFLLMFQESGINIYNAREKAQLLDVTLDDPRRLVARANHEGRFQAT